MQAYKMKGTIDGDGYLTIRSPIKMPPGEVEVIVLQPVAAVENGPMSATAPQAEVPKQQHQIKSLRDLLASAPPLPPDFDPDLAKWEYLKEKHNL